MEILSYTLKYRVSYFPYIWWVFHCLFFYHRKLSSVSPKVITFFFNNRKPESHAIFSHPVSSSCTLISSNVVYLLSSDLINTLPLLTLIKLPCIISSRPNMWSHFSCKMNFKALWCTTEDVIIFLLNLQALRVNYFIAMEFVLSYLRTKSWSMKSDEEHLSGENGLSAEG